jgi:glycosyltransferase involved in cell wall biosynthesis
MKPLLAEAVQVHPYILRFHAMECLCPLNNVRLLLDGPDRFRQCQRHQFASPEAYAECVRERGRGSGALHQAQRALSGVGQPGYHGRLLRVQGGAEAVLVVNPLQEAMLSPYAETVRVVTAGMDPALFPWPDPSPGCGSENGARHQLLFAGLVDEPMKGFRVLHEACGRLWQRRQDFELVATADLPGRVDEYTCFVGWQSQAELPGHLRAAAVVVIPTIAQEALGRTAVEAMAAGRPVVASRLGGLPFTVADGATGLLSEPGAPADRWLPLACDSKIHRRHEVPTEYDTAFVGNVFPGPRADLLGLIQKQFARTFVGQPYFKDMARTYSASRLAFNWSIRNDVNMRVFEALGCGSMLITNDLRDNGQDELFRDGLHLATYREAEELLDKIAYYLSHDEIRERIAAAGRHDALTHHTYRLRMMWLLETVEEHMAGNGVPRSEPGEPAARAKGGPALDAGLPTPPKPLTAGLPAPPLAGAGARARTLRPHRTALALVLARTRPTSSSAAPWSSRSCPPRRAWCLRSVAARDGSAKPSRPASRVRSPASSWTRKPPLRPGSVWTGSSSATWNS